MSKYAKPNLLLFKNGDNFYFYDVNIDRIARIDEQIYNILLSQQKNGTVANSLEISKLASNGFLSTNRVEKVISPETDFIKDILNNKLHKLTLQVTQQCNFRCDYCIYSGSYENRTHENKNMSWETAKKGIDFLYDHSRSSNSISIGFYGGEPLLRYDLIKKVITYANQIFEGKHLSYVITTNGSLLTKEIAKFLIENNVSITISLDGPSEIHDKNRKFAANGKGTFEAIYKNITSIIKEMPEYRNKFQYSVVIDPSNSLSCVNDFIINDEMLNGSLVLTSFISSINRKDKLNVNAEFSADWEYLKFLYFLFLLSKINDKKHIEIYRRGSSTFYNFLKSQKMPSATLGEMAHHGGPCIPGQIRLFMSVDGNLFPCERVNEQSKAFIIGNIDEGFDYDRVIELLNIGQLTSKECKNCFAFRHCTICASLAYSGDELSYSKKTHACNNSRYQFLEILRDACTLQELGYRFDVNDGV